MALYEMALLGNPTDAQAQELAGLLAATTQAFGMPAGEVTLVIRPDVFRPTPRACAAALFFGGPTGATYAIEPSVDLRSVPVVPVVTTASAVAVELPPALAGVNCLFLDKASPDRVFAALLECVGLLPRQRRVFISYRRAESTEAALQLFSELSARQFDVFLDTHSIGVGTDFQEQLWHKLSDVDVLMMLDTPDYFTSRWTDAEYGRALAKGIGVLRVQWPDSTPSAVTGTASRAELLPEELTSQGRLVPVALERVCRQLEQVRSLSQALRTRSLLDSVRNAVELIEGKVVAIGPGRLMHITLRSGRRLSVQPTLGVPTAVTLEEALQRAGDDDCAVVYNHFGMMKRWQDHLDWLAERVGSRWIRQSEAAWDFAGWDAR
jgi:hypothetical protein